MTANPEEILASLQDVLARLAAPASVQLDYLREIGLSPSIDELALEFDDIAVLVPELVDDGRLTREQVETVMALDRMLQAMSGIDDLWNDAALQSDPRWAEVRDLARLGAERLRATV